MPSFLSTPPHPVEAKTVSKCLTHPEGCDWKGRLFTVGRDVIGVTAYLNGSLHDLRFEGELDNAQPL